MTKTLGMKFDTEKPRMGLLPPHALESVADVLTFGAKKYLPNNWKYVENGPERYLDASLRHINAYVKGEKLDKESGLPHLSHALCCLMFIVDLELSKKEPAHETIRVKTKYDFPNWPLTANPRDEMPKTTNQPYSLAEVMQFWKATR